MNWGQEAAQKEGVARTELQARLHHLEQMEARLKETEDARQTTNAELQQRHEELERSKAQYQEQLKARDYTLNQFHTLGTLSVWVCC